MKGEVVKGVLKKHGVNIRDLAANRAVQERTRG